MQEHFFHVSNYTDIEIIQALNSFLCMGDYEEKESNGASFNCFHIGELMMSIKDETLLWNTIISLKKKGFYNKNEQLIFKLNKTINTPEFTAATAVRIKAICYGILLKYECHFNTFQKYISHPSRLQINVNNGSVTSNLDEIIEDVNTDFIKQLKNEIIKSPKNEQTSKLEDAIRIMGELSIDYNTDEFKKHIERFTVLKENIPEDISKYTISEKNNLKKIWFQLSLEFAKGKISRKGHNYYYEDIEFESVRSISEYIGKNIIHINNPKSVKPYFSASINDILYAEKNIYGYDKINTTYDFCVKHDIKMCDDFIEKQKRTKRFL